MSQASWSAVVVRSTATPSRVAVQAKAARLRAIAEPANEAVIGRPAPL